MRATGTMLAIAGLLAVVGACRSGERRRPGRQIKVVRPKARLPSSPPKPAARGPQAAVSPDGGDLRAPEGGDPIARAEELLLAGNPTGARAVLAPILKKNPKAVAGWALLGRVFRRLKRNQEALRAFGRALALEPEQPLALRGACQVRAERGEAGPAVTVCRRAVQRFPEDVDTRFSLALSLMQAGKAQQAVRELKWVAHREPRKVDVRIPLGRAYLYLKRYADAERELAAAVRLDSKRTLAWQLLGRTRFDLGDLEGAIVAWKTALGQDPGRDEARHGLVAALRRMRRPAEALPYLEKMVERHPASVPLKRELASTQIEMGNYAAARATLEAAVELKPRDGVALHNLGVVNERLGRLDAARQALARAVSAAPGRISSRLLYANVLERQGRAREALAAYQEVVRRGGGSPEARMAARAVARLSGK